MASTNKYKVMVWVLQRNFKNVDTSDNIYPAFKIMGKPHSVEPKWIIVRKF